MNIAAERMYPTPVSHSPLLPLLLMSLAGQKNSPTTSSCFDNKYDYIVVGAGSAGSVVASRLSEKPCIRVLLLEAGDAPPLLNDVPAFSESFANTKLDWNYTTEPQKHTAFALKNNVVPWPSGRALGGSSILNAMLYVRGNHKNYDDWAEQGADGWSYKDVFRYFIKAENNQNNKFIQDGYHGVSGPLTVVQPPYHSFIKDNYRTALRGLGYDIVDTNGPRQTGFYDLQATIRKGERCSTAKAYLVPAENRTNLDIVAGAFVKKIVIEHGRAIGVVFDYGNVTYQVNASREVILSAGTTNSAQLLMLSGIGPKETLRKFKIKVEANLPVGQNFQEHCGAILNFVLPSRIPTIAKQLSDNKTILEYIKRKTGIFASPALVYMAFLKDQLVKPTVDFPNYELYVGESSVSLMKSHGVKPEIYEQVFKRYENDSIYACGAQILQPKSRGYVSIRSSNPYDPPIIDPNYYSNSSDVYDIIQGLKTCMKIGLSEPMLQLGSAPLNTVYPDCKNKMNDEDEYWKCFIQMAVITYHHQVGTARMGKLSDPSTVVDPKLKVKGIKGLRVVDASIMPIIPSGNTNVPTIMVAEKASDIIKETIYKC